MSYKINITVIIIVLWLKNTAPRTKNDNKISVGCITDITVFHSNSRPGGTAPVAPALAGPIFVSKAGIVAVRWATCGPVQSWGAGRYEWVGHNNARMRVVAYCRAYAENRWLSLNCCKLCLKVFTNNSGYIYPSCFISCKNILS